MRNFFFFLILTVTLTAQSSIESVQNKIEDLLTDSFFDTTLAAVDIYNLSTNEVLYQKNNKFLLHPASNMKVLTSAAGLLYLGADHQFKTQLYYTGKITGSILKGNLYFIGGGDPDFNTDDLSTFVDAVKSLGVTRVEGNLYADISYKDSLFWGMGWMWDDNPSTDAPYLSALNINGNTITISITPDAAGDSLKIKLIPETEYFTIKNSSKLVDRVKNPFYVIRNYYDRKDEFVISGDINKNQQSVARTFNVNAPHKFFLNLFKEQLEKNNISFKGKIDTLTTPPNAKQIHTFSRTYGQVIKELNKNSNNLNAEMTLFALGEKYFGKPSTASKGIKMIDSLIIASGLNPGNYRLVDGSGVSHYNLVTAELLLGVLKYFYYEQPELYRLLSDSFPFSGVDGTLRNRMRGSAAENNVKAKTGTLSGISCLSGYVNAKNGDIIAFSIMIQNHFGKTSRATGYQNRICEILAEYE